MASRGAAKYFSQGREPLETDSRNGSPGGAAYRNWWFTSLKKNTLAVCRPSGALASFFVTPVADATGQNISPLPGLAHSAWQ